MTKATDRLASAAIVIGMQLVFLALLVQSVRVLAPPPGIVREMTLFLPRLRPTSQQPPATGAATMPRPAIPTVPSILSPPDVPPAGANVQGLGKFLFGCAPEAYATLPPEERARCPKPGEGLAVNAPPDPLTARSHVKNEALWASDLARKQSAPWAPCTTVMYSYGLPPTRAFDLKCLTPLFASGAIADPRQWQVYDQEEIAAADKRKLQQAYDEWRGRLTANSPPPPSAGRALADRRSRLP